MKLKKVTMRGYRSVQLEEELLVDDRVTILIGANDHGKSNLLNAIRCLNEEVQISTDDRNWDLDESSTVEIKWHFIATDDELEKLRELGRKALLASASTDTSDPLRAFLARAGQTKTPASQQEPATQPSIPPQPSPEAQEASANPAVNAPNPASLDATATPAVTPEPSSGSDAAETPLPATPAQSSTEPPPAPPEAAPPSQSQQSKPVLEPDFPLSASLEIIFGRDSVTNKVQVLALPVHVPVSNAPDVLSLRPVVELFESPSGNVIDQVNTEQLDTPQFEFMQGIFRLAGLWEHRNIIFKQNATTSKLLDQASETLTRTLNESWNQGKELRWKFKHTGTNGDHIIIEIEDPAIKGRYTRPSLRSSGFRTYFLLSMIIYARTRNKPNHSYIYLFDEPGTYLHPSAQLDLQRSFEAIADQAQIVYTTHSLFLVSKNYPERNRVISKTKLGTKIDQKPFTKNWKSVRESLGILLSNNFLIAEKTLLVEGPSDIIYLLDAMKEFKAAGALDIDLNDLSIVDAGDSQNYVAMAKLMLSEGREVVALLDGDAGGKAIAGQLRKICGAEIKAKKITIQSLPSNKSSEDIFANLETLRSAVQAAYDSLIKSEARKPVDGMNMKDAVERIAPRDDCTLGRILDQETQAWFAPPEKISKLLVALLYEDVSGRDPKPLPEDALGELEKVKDLLKLRGEKSERFGVFETSE
jgi:predicted ATP-dependent endonuclease of OLD family